ncbi:MAG TPA: D-2-hydroxyacid dehydrogenase family protein [Thermohalobaculum sp.]|nr:D-2-hydroxyacid dehydrogenase family protein [Thermohalobaculum sp.]
MKIAVLDDYQNVARDMADWSRLERDHEVTFFDQPYEGLEGFTTRLAPFEIVCIMRERSPFGREVIERLPGLKLLVTAGMRNAAIDMEAARERGVPVLGTGGSVESTPELAWGLMLSLARHIHVENARMREGSWITTLGTDVAGATLGIIGLGRLGRRMAEIGRVFGMEVIAWSQNLTDEQAEAAGVRRVGKDELFREADFITIHYKLGERSRKLVGARELGLMQPTAFLVNTSRGPVVDTEALVAALTEGRIAGAGIDVYDEEPLPADHPLRSCPRTLLTPHLGYVTRNTYRAFYGEIVEDIEAWLAGNPLRVLSP